MGSIVVMTGASDDWRCGMGTVQVGDDITVKRASPAFKFSKDFPCPNSKFEKVLF
jgi:hypothetical protein